MLFRSSILGAIGAALTGTPNVTHESSRTNELRVWHDAAHKQFVTDARKFRKTDFLALHNVQYSYSIARGDGQKLDPAYLKEVLLLQLSNEVHDRVRTGWSMFYPFTRDEIPPHFIVDESSGEGDEDFIECALLRDTSDLGFYADMWRISTGGKATLIRPYWEDKEDWNRSIERQPGSWLSPALQIRSLSELLRHAQAFAEKFDAPVSVTLTCEWRGLSGRTIFHPGRYYSVGGLACTDQRRVTKEIPMASLANSWPEIVSDFLAPVIRLFNTSFKVTPDGVRSEAPDWLHL